MEKGQRINQMIKEARRWLDRAQDSYKNNNPVRGELNLHLAQAEIQRACETSREMLGKNMFAISKSQREQQPAWLRYYSMGAVAAMVGILFFMGINLILFSDGEERLGEALVAASWTHPVQIVRLTEPLFGDMFVEEQFNAQSRVVASQTAYKSNQRRSTKNQRLSPRRRGRSQTVAANAHNENDSTYYDLQDSRYYSLPGSMNNEWQDAPVSNWGEERNNRNSVPSFSER